MSSPLQHPKDLRPLNGESHSTQAPPPQPPSLQQKSASPFSNHLPPPPLSSSNGPSGHPLSLPPPPRSYQSPMQSPLNPPSTPYGMVTTAHSNHNSPSLNNHTHATSRPPPPAPSSSFPPSADYSSKPILPPLPTAAARAPSPYDDRHSTTLPPPAPPVTPSSQYQQQSQGHHRQRSITRTPPQPQPAQQQRVSSPAESSNQSAPSGYRPLNVRDALTYLDQVKVRFSDQPDVYNRFLDIMKDFKSQAIDTPGVIERVSTLFKGHSMLISGFNTFLPPGYRIECSTDPHEPDLIRVTTPNGTTTTTGERINMEPPESMMSAPSHHHPSYYHYQQPPHGLPQYHYQSAPPPPMPSIPPPPTQSYTSHYGDTPPPSSSSSMMAPSSTPVSSSPYMPMGQAPPPVQPTSPSESGKRSPVEFNHAINYVNKIKNRFANEPDVYKQFLEILQTYQKEQKPIQEVYAHVQYLFNGAPDLLAEFKQFLPDITGQPASALFGDDDQDISYYDDGGKHGAGGPLMSQKKKRGPIPLGAMGKRSKMYHKYDEMEASFRADPYAFPASPFDPVHPMVTAEEVELFERIRKYIGNKPSYEEFLKTLNLYTQQIVDLDLLMEQVEVFIGSNKELFDWFKSVLGYESKERPIRRPARALPKPDLMHCATVPDSPSYRLAPVNWQNQPCSGRDQLAWEVLNDVYVSHPIWASEDDGFVASKKSQYEEAMHRCEEERYDYNMNIEANLNTIALLEPISKKLEMMTLDEKAAYRLYPGLGGQSVTIYERIIKKVYDKERGIEIIDLLYNNPAQVVPILLKRLKKKDEEWKKEQCEWNKIWRELDTKNYYRSLDYQGITFKGNDRKAMTVKSMVTEIESLHKNNKVKQIHKNASSKKAHCQFMFDFPDKDVFKDVTRVVYSYIDRQTGFSSHDREKVRTFIRSFVPLCFDVDNVEPEGVSNYSEDDNNNDDDDDDTMEDDDDAQSTNTEDSESDVTRSPASKRSTSPSPRRSRRGRNQEDDHTMDLLRDVLMKNKKALDETAPVNGSTTTTINGKEKDMDVDIPDATTTTITTATDGVVKSESPEQKQQDLHVPPSDSDKLLTAAAVATAPGSRKRMVYSFFCNTTFYAFFRLFEMIYGRLFKLKQLDELYMSDPRYGKKTNETALQLGLYTTKFNDIDTSNGFYQAVLDLVDRFFEGDIEPQFFEESIRYLFVTDAYVLFTIDKLVHAFVKQIQAVTVDTDSVELVRLFRSDQELEVTSSRLLSVYRLRAEEIVGSEENLYKINFDKKMDRMTIQLLDSDDYMLEPNKEDKYEYYISSYMNWVDPTEDVDVASMKPTFLKRNLRLRNENLDEIFVRSQLQYKIDQDTYHMYYIDGSEDVFIRPGISSASQKEDTS